MREIKFRAFIKKKRLESVMTNNLANIAGFSNYGDKKGVLGCQHENVVLMQFTGLKDKNGVEIYEGDIIAAMNYQKNVTETSAVEFDKGGFFLDSYSLHSWLESYSCKVIGNIHSNPELLEVK